MIWGHELAPVSWLSQVHEATLRVLTYALLLCYFFHWASDSPPAMRDLPLDFPTLFPPPSAQAASKQGPPVSPHTGFLQLVMDLIVGAGKVADRLPVALTLGEPAVTLEAEGLVAGVVLHVDMAQVPAGKYP